MRFINKSLMILGTVAFCAVAHAGKIIPEGSELDSQLKSSQSYIHATFNIDTNIGRTEEGYASDSHAAWRVKNRMSALQDVLTQLRDAKVDSITLQETRKFVRRDGENVDSITPIMDHLRSLGYDVLKQKYNPADPSDLVFCYITAWNPGYLEMVDQRTHYLTRTPDKATDHPDTTGLDAAAIKVIDQRIKENNFGEYWERCLSITTLRDYRTDKRVHLINTHLGIGAEHRIEASRIISEVSKSILDKDLTAKIICSGDFNSFPDAKGPEQMQAMEKAGVLKQATSSLKLPNGKVTHSSFIAFPFDFGSKEQKLNLKNVIEALSTPLRTQLINTLFGEVCNALGGHLDRVFYAGFGGATSYLVPTLQFADGESIDFTSESEVKAYIMRHIGSPAFASDHQPVLTLFE